MYISTTVDVLPMLHYDPFGMLLVGRNWNVGSEYRYEFNGKESDSETYGEGNIYDYGFRIYNPRLGKFLSVDPLAKSFPWWSPFQFAGNMPIWAIDLDGLEIYKTSDGKLLGKIGNSLDIKVVDAGFTETVMMYIQWTNTATSDKAYAWNYDVVNNPIYTHELSNSINSAPLTSIKQESWREENNYGLITPAPEGSYENAPVHAFLKDVSYFCLAYFYPCDAIDNAITTWNNPNATANDNILAGINVVLAGTGGKRGTGPTTKVTLYRGGETFEVRPKIDQSINPKTGLVTNEKGVSLNSDPTKLDAYGGAYEIISIPDQLEIFQSGKAGHFEIVPKVEMTPEEFQNHLNQIKTKKRE